MLTDEQKFRMIKIFKKTLKDLTLEKLNFPDLKWQKFVKNTVMNLKFEVLSLDWKEHAGDVWYTLKNGEFKISEDPLPGVKIKIRAPLGNVFDFSRRKMSTLKALLGGLKISGKRNLRMLLKLSKLFRTIPEKDYKKQGLATMN